MKVMLYKLEEIITEYSEKSTSGLFKPVAVGKYGIRQRSDIYKKELAKDYSKNKLIYTNTMIVGMGSTQIDFGVLTENEIYSVSPAYHTFKINTSIINSKYFEYLLQAKNKTYTQKYMIASARQGKTVNLKDLMKESIEIPSFDEQELIIERIALIGKLMKNGENELNLLNELIKSRFIEMFGNPIDNPHNFELNYLSNLGYLSRGKSKHRPRNDPKLLGGTYPLIQTGDVKQADLYISHYESTYSEFGLNQSKLWPKGTLCITIAANIAETAILKFDACFPDSVVGFIANEKVNTIFIRYQIEALKEFLNSKATEVAQKNLNIEKLESVQFMTPEINLQNEFASFVEQVDKLKFVVKKRIDLYKELLDKKMDEYFN